MSQTPTDAPSPWRLPTRVGAAFLLTGAALSSAGWLGQTLGTATGLHFRVQHLIQGLVMSGLVLPGLLWLRLRADRGSLRGTGVLGWSRGLASFAAGAGLVAVPTAVSLGSAAAFGWASLSVDLSPSGLGLVALAVVTALLFEAVPEELAFRGYIYHNLATAFRRWVASGLTVVLFVALPVLVVQVQAHLLGMEILIGGSTRITTSYMVTMVVFGIVTQYLRVVSGSVWTGVGFHLAFLLLNRLMGPVPERFIHVSEVAAPGPMRMVAMGSALAALGLALAWPWLRGGPVGWNRRVEEGRTA